MSCAQALRAVTSESAQYLRLARTGELRVDYAADLILLDGNPLENLHCLRQPVAVLKSWTGDNPTLRNGSLKR